jgi:hypothetical protein
VQEDAVNTLRTNVRGAALAVAAFVSLIPSARAQDTAATDTAGAVRELQDQVRQLRGLVNEMRSENAQSRAEMQQLRQDLRATRALLEQPGVPLSTVAPAEAQTAPPPGSVEASRPSNAPLEERVQKLEESTSLLGSKIDEHYQTKVETASKYRARLHGIVLFNAFRNVGNSNNLDLPDFAESSRSFIPQTSFGATLRQSEIGLEIFGPDLAGAKTSANLQMDFAGGFPAVGNGVNFGIARIQTASLRFDWKHTSVIAGQDSLYLSPLSPTSFASLATPAFAAAGNLWSWTPQIRVEHKFEFSDQHYITLQAGILDNLNWEPPQDSYARNAQAGENSGQPAYGMRAAWSHLLFGRPLSFGAAGYYGRQHWSWDRYVDSWAGMMDWQIPLAPRLTLSGEFYRGKGVGTFGAGINRPVLFGGSPFSGSTPIRGLDSAGGWGQLTVQLTPKLDFNGVFADDNAYAGDIRGFAIDDNNFSTILGRNRGMLGNFVYRPRSDLLFSAEFRRLRSYPVYSDSSMTNQLSVAMGILF